MIFAYWLLAEHPPWQLTLLLAVLPVLIHQVGEGIRERLRRKEQLDRIDKLEARIAELERWRRS